MMTENPETTPNTTAETTPVTTETAPAPATTSTTTQPNPGTGAGVNNSSGVVYNLRGLQTPIVSGVALKFMVAAVENSHMLQNKVLQDQNTFVLRNLDLHEEMTVLPFKYVPIDKNEHEKKIDLQEFLANSGNLKRAEGFHFLTIMDYHNAYKEGKVTPEDIAKRFCDSLTQSNSVQPPLNAFIASNKDDIMAMAKESTKRYKEGKPISIFDGVPIPVKDEMDQIGYGTTLGTKVYGKTPATKDAEVVKKLRDAGALLLGKTNMHEIGIGVTGANVHHGYPRNPYDPTRHTGGSSSGSAAATAAGFCPFSIGTDGGGSIRVPAAFCGLVGLKATWGRITENGIFPTCPSLGHVGPIGATAFDCALAYGLLAGPDPEVPLSLSQPAPSLSDFFKTEDLSGVRIGIYSRYFEDGDPKVVATCKSLLDKYVARGAKIVEIEIPHLDEMKVAHMITIVNEMKASIFSKYNTQYHQFSLTSRLILATNVPSVDFILAQKMRTCAMNIFEGIFQNVDVIATPASAVIAPPINEAALLTDELNATNIGLVMRYAFIANLIGVPAISFPAGYIQHDSKNIPVSLQLMGRWWDENTLLRLANVADELIAREKPVIHYPLMQ